MTSRYALAAIAALVMIGEATGRGPLLLGGGSADAVVGRPLTPVSYAGVARRTTRRAAYAGAYYHPAAPAAVAAGAAAGAATAATIAALPAGCVMAAGIYTCGAVRYRPVYDGPTVVYQVVY